MRLLFFALAVSLDTAAAAAIIPGAQYFIYNVANNGPLAVDVGFASLLEANPENVATQWIPQPDTELGSYRLFSPALQKEVTLDNTLQLLRLGRATDKSVVVRIDQAGLNNTFVIKTPNENSVWTLTGHGQVGYAPSIGEQKQLWRFRLSEGPGAVDA
ncbi:hypothetical protein EXIGLDRAFT_843016 [Exidia glandulosa HHB12029]|uniref:Ricin B lectin domain-containing protein n=1 Tax=Exidia glandulosa HHB12029 TaxID=1314781 RepID=A0A165CXD3_EXIGL|nr:hypothetical protein EXIGLDRAFT_843016 [Exidia glandulosa HHB12029]